MSKKITAGRDLLGDIAPKFAELNDDVLFGEVWAREDKLSARDRSLITVTGLMASGILDSSLKFHLKSALENGVTREELAEAITHLGFYVGWPKTWAVFRLLKEIYSEDGTADPVSSLFGKGDYNEGYAKYFNGNIVDPGMQTAIETRELLKAKNMLSDRTDNYKVQYYVTKDIQNFKNVAKNLTKIDIDDIYEVSIEAELNN